MVLSTRLRVDISPPARPFCHQVQTCRDDRNRAVSSPSEREAPADDPGMGTKDDVPNNRCHAEIVALGTMVREVPHLC